MSHTSFRTAYDCLPSFGQLALALDGFGSGGAISTAQHRFPPVRHAAASAPVDDAAYGKAECARQVGCTPLTSHGFFKNVHTHDFNTVVSGCETHSYRQNDGMNDVAKRLKEARSLKDWNQAQLAVAAGVSPGTIGNIESGARQSKGSLPQIAKALGVRHDWLANGIDPMYEKPKPPSEMGNGGGPSSQAALLAILFDKLDNDVVLRAQVFNRASEVILRTLQGTEAPQAPEPAPQIPAKKQTS